MPRVSVVMPAYNDQRYVAETIQSVLAQTYQDFEFIITNNGSTDETGNIIKTFTDPRIKLLTLEKNRGHCGGMNNSIRAAKGEFLALLNADDLYAPDKLEKQVKFLDENPHVGIVFSYAEIIDKDSKPFGGQTAYNGIFDRPNKANRFEWLNNFFLNDNCLCHPSALIRKKCQEKVGFFDERLALLLDLDYWIRTCLKYDIYIIPEKLTKFRVHESQGSAGTPQTHSLHYIELIQVLKHYMTPEVLDSLSAIFSKDTLQQIYTEQNMADIDQEIEPLILSMLKDINNLEPELKPFFIGMLGFWVSRPPHRTFALDILYQTYHNQTLVEKIRARYNYDYANLIKLAKAQDVFGVVSASNINTQLDYANRGLENLHTELNQIKKELETAKTQLNKTQQELALSRQQQNINTVNTGNTTTYISQSRPIINSNNNYQLWIEKAVVAYQKKDLSTMVQSLEESLKHTSVLATETVLDWMSNLANCSGKNSNHIKISELIKSAEWKKLMESVLKYQENGYRN
jgi:glycosyltransferase involved in cell wall biosynthesis